MRFLLSLSTFPFLRSFFFAENTAPVPTFGVSPTNPATCCCGKKHKTKRTMRTTRSPLHGGNQTEASSL